MSQSTSPPLCVGRSGPPQPGLCRIVLACGFAAALAGCGLPGPVRPPSLDLPDPATNLTAERRGDIVRLAWRTPLRSTDKLPLKGPLTGWLCRAVEHDPCVRVGGIEVKAGTEATYEDHLPPQLAGGAPQLLTYTLELVNQAAHSAGLSNPAFAASGEAPANIASLAAEVRPDGVVLRLPQPPGSATVPEYPSAARAFVRLQRHLVLDLPGKASPLASRRLGSTATFGRSIEQAPREDQTLLVPQSVASFSGERGTSVLDTSAASDRAYTYTAQRVLELDLAGHTITIAGEPSQPITVSTRDTFPPAVPSGLVAVAVAEEHAIDLSWTPDTEPDLAGYVVYRRETPSGSLQRLTPVPVAAPAFRDPTAISERRYAYSVSAIDLDGNESRPSTEVEEALPPQ